MAIQNQAIKRIEVKRLFGMFDYELEPLKTADGTEKILILYGDNGSGKTTILKTVFHLLAPENREGHKSIVASIPFSRFEIELMSGDLIWAHRTQARKFGSFEMGLKRLRGKEVSILFEANEENSVKARSKKQEIDHRVFLSKLRALGVSLYLLSDDRTSVYI